MWGLRLQHPGPMAHGKRLLSVGDCPQLVCVLRRKSALVRTKVLASRLASLSIVIVRGGCNLVVLMIVTFCLATLDLQVVGFLSSSIQYVNIEASTTSYIACAIITSVKNLTHRTC